ncbi:MAG: DUF5011 domain-containing protein [Candidatus Magasanikbacteria bacterium]|nr:DUF5011 domain-containing protein [Candidatus Magasanikbacteria bacterium]
MKQIVSDNLKKITYSALALLVVVSGFTFAPTAKAVTPAIVAFNFATPAATGVIDEAAHTVAVTVPFGTDVTALVPTIDSGADTVNPASGVAQNFTSPVTYTVTATVDGTTQDYIVTVTVAAITDLAAIDADKAALVDSLIQGANPDLAHITTALANPLPSVGSVYGSTITWGSSNTAVVSNDGQTVARPAFAAGDAAISMTATFTRGSASDAKVFSLIVSKLPASTVATVTSSVYTVSVGGTAAETITNVPFGASKASFLGNLTKDNAGETLGTTGVDDPVVSGNTVVVTAEDGTTTVTYTIDVVAAPLSSAKAITAFSFATPTTTGTIDEAAHTVAITVPFGTAVTALVPTIVVSMDASITPVSGVAQDFTNPVTYTVTAADATTQVYTVTVTVTTSSDLTALVAAIATASTTQASAVEGTLPGQYPAPLKANLQTAITAAAAITGASSQSVVDAAVATLNAALATFTAGKVPPDTTAPVITLLGANPVNLFVGGSYVDAGATSTDNIDGDITARIVTVNPVNTAVADAYMVTYNVTDTAGNHATQVTRTVTVVVAPPSGGSSGGAAPVVYTTPPAAPVTGFVVNINNGGSKTDSRTITLHLDGGPQAKNMAISNSPNFDGIPQEPYQPTKQWTLSGGAGEKTVYVVFFSQYGTMTRVVSQHITLVESATVVEPAGRVLGVKITKLDTLLDELKPNQRHPKVKELQAELKQRGYFGANFKPTDFYGKLTAAAVKKYKEGAAASVVSSPSLDALIAALRPNRHDVKVTELQASLKKLGLFPANWRTTDFYGKVTQAAVKKYQETK